MTTVADLIIGESFYLAGEPKSIFITIGFSYYKSGRIRQCKAAPTGKLYPLYFGRNKEIIKVINKTIQCNETPQQP